MGVRPEQVVKIVGDKTGKIFSRSQDGIFLPLLYTSFPFATQPTIRKPSTKTPGLIHALSAVETLFNQRDVLLSFFVVLDLRDDLTAGMHGRGVVTAAELMTNSGKRGVELFAE